MTKIAKESKESKAAAKAASKAARVRASADAREDAELIESIRERKEAGVFERIHLARTALEGATVA